MYEREKSYWLKHIDFILVDLILVEFSYYLAMILRNGKITPIANHIGLALGAIFVLTAILGEFYHAVLRRSPADDLIVLARQFVTNLVISTLYMYAVKEVEQSRIALIGSVLLGYILVAGAHQIRRMIYRKMKERGDKHASQMILFLTEDHLDAATELIDRQKYEEYQVSRLVIVDSKAVIEEYDGVPVIANVDEAQEYMRSHVVDEAFLYMTGKYKLTNELANYFEQMGVTTHICLEGQFGGESANQMVRVIGSFQCLTRSLSFAKSSHLILKRLMDIAGGLVGTLITAVITIIFGPIIYIQSPGPIFFSQTRIGKNGRQFKIYKFRSMYPDAEERKKELMAQNKMNGLMFKMDNDPRIIPIGHFMRKTSLDEFPQFLNVLKGDMSLVGTRPPTMDEYKYYEYYHKKRLAAKPGITGMWQVSGRSDITDFEEVVKLDSKYIENWSFSMDVYIILKTIKVVLLGKGAE